MLEKMDLWRIETKPSWDLRYKMLLKELPRLTD